MEKIERGKNCPGTTWACIHIPLNLMLQRHNGDGPLLASAELTPFRLPAPRLIRLHVLCWIPDWTVSCVEILCCHSSYNGALWCVLINIHRVGRFTEDGRLIHIQNVYFHCRCVFEWAKIMEPWIQVCIGGLHFKCVCFFGLIVQRLRKDKQREN